MVSMTFISWIYHFWARFWPYLILLIFGLILAFLLFIIFWGLGLIIGTKNQGSWTLDPMLRINERRWRTKGGTEQTIFVFKTYLFEMFILIESEESKIGGGELRIWEGACRPGWTQSWLDLGKKYLDFWSDTISASEIANSYIHYAARSLVFL